MIIIYSSIRITYEIIESNLYYVQLMHDLYLYYIYLYIASMKYQIIYKLNNNNINNY